MEAFSLCALRPPLGYSLLDLHLGLAAVVAEDHQMWEMMDVALVATGGTRARKLRRRVAWQRQVVWWLPAVQGTPTTVCGASSPSAQSGRHSIRRHHEGARARACLGG